MNRETIKIRMETTYIRSRAWVRLLVTLAGISLMLLGAYNLLAVPLLEAEAVVPYPRFALKITATDGGAYFIGDAIVICLGAVIAWFS